MFAVERLMQSTHEVPHELFRGLLVCAVRYALPRHTYVVSEARDWITKLAGELNNGDLEVMRRDIEQTLEEHERGYRRLHECDRETWQEMFQFVDNLLQERKLHEREKQESQA